MKRFRLSQRDMSIIRSLTRQVRLMTCRQVAEIWWKNVRCSQGCLDRLNLLQRLGWVEKETLLVHPLLHPDEPLVRWKPGDHRPCFEVVAQVSRGRWSAAATPTEVVAASRKAANLMGSTSWSIPRSEHWNHDLHLAQVFVDYYLNTPVLAQHWVGENVLPKAGHRIKDPDAFIVDASGKVRLVVESAGRYGVKQVESFHRHCVRFRLPYELW